MKKRLLSTLLALCMVLVLLPGTVQAAGKTQSGKYGDLTWEYEPKLNEYGWEIAGGTLTISGTGKMPDSNTPYSNTAPWSEYLLHISKVIIEPGVTSIGSFAFRSFDNLTDLSIPSSVTVIGEGAFSLCRSLTNIAIPDSVTTIEVSAFSDCSSLTSIIIPNSVTMIGASAFASCSNLASITIPGTVTAISKYSFSHCNNLSEITIQEGVKYIESSAFLECRKLTHISIPASVTHIGSNSHYEAFSGCTNLSEIVVNPQNTEYTSSNGALFTKEKDTILLCPQGKTTFIIPNSVSVIGASAFSNCTKLTAVTIPNNINNIGYSAFSNCTSLTNITIPEGVKSFSSTFSGCSNLKTRVHSYQSYLYWSRRIL